MFGQFVVLPGIRSGAPAGAPKLDLANSDIVALRIDGLKLVVSPRTFAAVAGGGITAKCRLTNEALVTRGSQTALQVETVGGKLALAVNSASAGLVGLALPPGSLTRSYIAVMAVNEGVASMATGSPTNLLNGFDESNAWVSNPIRYTGGVGIPSDAYSARGGDTVNTYAASSRSPGVWNLVIVDFDNNTRIVSIGVNSVGSLVRATKAAGRVPAVTDFLEIGYHLSATSLRDSKIGDLFTFDRSLLSTDLGLEQVADLVAALKIEYGIA